MPFMPSSRHAPAVPPVGPPIIKKIVSTPSRLKQCAIISSPRKVPIGLMPPLGSLVANFSQPLNILSTGASPSLSCDNRRHKRKRPDVKIVAIGTGSVLHGSHRGMKFGLFGMNMRPCVTPEAIATVARAAEHAGFESFWGG